MCGAAALKTAVLVSIFCVLVFASSCATVGRDPKVQADAHYKLGVAYLNEDKVQPAFVEFHKALDLDPDNRDVLNAIGIVFLLHYDNIPKAIGYFEKAVKEDPEFSEGYNSLGYANEKLGRFDKAIEYFKKALSNPLYPTPEKAYVNMGDSYYRLGRYDDALAAFKEAIKRAPGLGLPFMRLALCYNAMRRYGDSATAMTEAITLDPQYKGSREKAAEDLKLKKLRASGYDEQDIRDYLEILKY